MQHITEEKIDKQVLLSKYKMMDFDLKTAKSDLKDLINWYKSLPNELILYRIVNVDDKNNINLKKLGSHYSYDKIGLSSSHSFVTGYGDKKYLITVKAKKSMIDVIETLSNNILYPNEKEITLKDKGKGVEVLSVRKISRNKVIESLTENTNRLTSTLLTLLNNEGLYKSLKITGLDTRKFFDIIKDSEIEIDAGLANEIILELISNKLVTTKYKHFTISVDSFSGIVIWFYNHNSETMESFCTPFYEDFNEVPIYIRAYENRNVKPSVYSEIEEDSILHFPKSPTQKKIFNNFLEVVDWYEHWYLPKVYTVLFNGLEKQRNKLS